MATPSSRTATRIVAPVPSGATTGPVTVTVGSVSSNGVTFTLSPTPSTITLVQHRSRAGSGPAAALAFTSNNAAGNFIAVAVRIYGTNQTITVRDSGGNTYQQAVKLNNSFNDTLGIYYAQNIGGGANTVTVSPATPSDSIRFAILEYAGIATSGALDVTKTNARQSASPTSGNVTTTASGDLLLGAFSVAEYRTFTAGSGYTIRQTVDAPPSTRLMVEDRIQATAGTTSATATMNASERWAVALAAFRKAPSGGAAMLTQLETEAHVTGTLADRTPANRDTSVATVRSIATTGDFDGDGKTDVAVYRPSSRSWRILESSTGRSTSLVTESGASSVIPVAGDYDGDGKADVAHYRPSTGAWSILESSTNHSTSQSVSLGNDGDVPVAGDYDGDKVTDIAVYRPATGEWQILKSSESYATSFVTVWGDSGDVPVPADYDGDGKIDLAVYRPGTGLWRILESSTDYATSFALVWGTNGDNSVPADYDGDGRTDLATYRPSTGTWNVLLSSTSYSTSVAIAWGSSSDELVPGDYDGDGKADLGLFRSGAWQIRLSHTNYGVSVSWGQSGDVPLFKHP